MKGSISSNEVATYLVFEVRKKKYRPYYWIGVPFSLPCGCKQLCWHERGRWGSCVLGTASPIDNGGETWRRVVGDGGWR
jgi:hypothetical protein